jgi:hypothetical protein
VTYCSNEFLLEVENRSIFQIDIERTYLRVDNVHNLTKKLIVLNNRIHEVKDSKTYVANKWYRRFCKVNNWKNSRYIGSIRDISLNGKKLLFFQVLVNGKIFLGCNFFERYAGVGNCILPLTFFMEFRSHIINGANESSFFAKNVWYC